MAHRRHHPKTIKLIADRFGLTSAEARQLADHPRVEEIRDQHERWRMSVGLPDTASPLSRGKLLEMMRSGRDNPRLTPDITVHGRMPTKLEYETSLDLLRRMPMPATARLSDVEQTAIIALQQQGLVRTKALGGPYNNELVLTDYGKLYLSQRTKNNPQPWARVFG